MNPFYLFIYLFFEKDIHAYIHTCNGIEKVSHNTSFHFVIGERPVIVSSND